MGVPKLQIDSVVDLVGWRLLFPLSLSRSSLDANKKQNGRKSNFDARSNLVGPSLSQSQSQWHF